MNICLNVAPLILLLSGCAVFNDEYSCGQVPEVACKPLSDVYNEADDSVYDYRSGLYQQDGGGKEEAQINVGKAHRVLNYAAPGDPVLTKPIVMRVLYRSYKNDQKDLDAGGYNYLVMKESEWLVQK